MFGDSVSGSLDTRLSSYVGVYEGEDVMRGDISEGVGPRQNSGVWRATRKQLSEARRSNAKARGACLDPAAAIAVRCGRRRWR